jgi:hypothetical protein
VVGFAKWFSIDLSRDTRRKWVSKACLIAKK